MSDELQNLSLEELHAAYVDESQNFLIAEQNGATEEKLSAIKQKLKKIMEAIARKENEQLRS